jgi:hypothetical protein
MEKVPFTIHVTPEQNKKIQSLAQSEGLSAESFALKKLLNGHVDASEEDPYAELRAFLMPRIEAARAGEISSKSFDEMIAEADAEFDA